MTFCEVGMEMEEMAKENLTFCWVIVSPKVSMEMFWQELFVTKEII